MTLEEFDITSPDVKLTKSHVAAYAFSAFGVPTAQVPYGKTFDLLVEAFWDRQLAQKARQVGDPHRVYRLTATEKRMMGERAERWAKRIDGHIRKCQPNPSSSKTN